MFSLSHFRPISVLAFTVTILAGCNGPVRTTGVQVTNVTANGSNITINAEGQEPVVDGFRPETRFVPALPFVIPADDADDPILVTFRRLLAPVADLSKEPDLDRRAVVLAAARQGLLALVSQCNDIGLRRALNVDICLLCLALGDEPALHIRMAALTADGYSPSTAFMRDQLAQNAELSTDQIIQRLLSFHETKWHLPATGTIIERSSFHREGAIPEAQPAQVVFADATVRRRTFPGVELVCRFQLGEKLGKIGIEVTNRTERVLAVRDLAVRIVHNGVTTRFATVDVEYRMLPGETAIAWVAPQAGDVLLTDVISGASVTPSTLTVYDVPVEFDPLGAVTRKENVAWEFTFTPAGQSRRLQNLTKMYEFRRGMDRLTPSATAH